MSRLNRRGKTRLILVTNVSFMFIPYLLKRVYIVEHVGLKSSLVFLILKKCLLTMMSNPKESRQQLSLTKTKKEIIIEVYKQAITDKKKELNQSCSLIQLT